MHLHSNNMINIKCIGFSVTAYMDDSYPIDLQRRLDVIGDNKFSVSYISLGGLSIDSMPFLMDKLIDDERDQIIIFELATSWYSLFRSDFNIAYKLIKEIVNYAELTASEIIFLNLYRKDLDDQDIVIKAIEQVAAGKHSIINLKKHFRTLLNETGNDLTVDGVHPTKDAIKFISEQIFKRIMDIHNDVLINKFTDIRQSKFCYRSWLPERHSCEDIIFDNRKGFKSRAIKIRGGEYLEFEFPAGINVSGIFFAMGPDTAIAEFFLDNQKIDVEMKDEMSFYRRLGFKEIEPKFVNKIKIYQPNTPSQVKLNRDPWEKVDGVNCYLVGIATMQDLIPC